MTFWQKLLIEAGLVTFLFVAWIGFCLWRGREL